MQQTILLPEHVDVDVFNDLSTIVPVISRRATLYISAKNKALEASSWIHDFPRAGYLPPYTVVAGIDTVEVTNVDLTLVGHGYASESAAVLYDIFTLISSNMPPSRRARPSPAINHIGRRNWSIGP